MTPGSTLGRVCSDCYEYFRPLFLICQAITQVSALDSFTEHASIGKVVIRTSIGLYSFGTPHSIGPERLQSTFGRCRSDDLRT